MANLDVDDPWNWSVDRVVQELCTPNRSWQPRNSVTAIPSSVALESKIRDELVDGNILLVDVDDDVMRRDLGLIKLGWRGFVRSAIEDLRLQSAQYQKYVQKHHSINRASSHHSASVVDVGYQVPQHGFDRQFPFGQPQPIRPSQIPPTPPAQAQQLLSAYNCSPAGGSPENLQDGQDPIILHNKRSRNGEFLASDDSCNKRRKLDITNSAGYLDLHNEDDACYQIYQSEEPKTPTRVTPTPTPAVVTIPTTDINGKKRKRIAPTLITSQIDPNRDRGIPTAADNVVHNDPSNIEPGVPFIGDDGRKRLVPIREPDADSAEPYNYRDLLRNLNAPRTQALEAEDDTVRTPAKQIPNEAQRKKSILSIDSQAAGYLGKQKICVDAIFYEGTQVGQELPPSEPPQEFYQGPKKISNGRRTYVHRVIKRFLNSERQIIVRDGKVFSAVRPYPGKLTPRHHKPSFTLFYSTEDGNIHARREEVPSWPEIDPESPLQRLKTDTDGNSATFNIAGLEMLDSFRSGDEFDPDCLLKYNYLHGGDEVLPLYGESDEENEYDLDTWREIENEQGTLTKPMAALRRPHLGLDEIHEAIDEGIAELVVKWKKEKLPNRQQKAYKIWMKHRPKHLRQAQIRNRQQDLDRMNQRIARMRKEIAEEVWTSRLQVRKQTRILEPSIFDREDWIWEISLLESKKQPEKLARQERSEAASKKSNAPSDDGEEGESIESHSEAFSSDGDLDDFIDNDIPSADEEKELNLADAEEEQEEEEDSSLSDTSLLDTSPRLASARKLLFKRFKAVTSDYDEPVPHAPDNSSNLARYADSDPGKQQRVSTPCSPIKASVKEELTPTKVTAISSSSVPELIDLTLLSSDDGPPVINLITPKKKKPLVKLVHRSSPFSSPIIISDESDAKIPDSKNLPPYDNPAAVAKYSYQTWVNTSDRERLLISVLQSMEADQRASIFALVSAIAEKQLWLNMNQVLEAVCASRGSVKGVDDGTFETLLGLIRLFAIYADCKYYPYLEKPSKSQVENLRTKRRGWYAKFYQFCSNLEEYFDGSSGSNQSPTPQKIIENDDDDDDDDDDDGDDYPRSAVRRRPRAINTTDSDDPLQSTPHKVKRKKKVYEDAHARTLRELDRQRLAEQEERRKNLQAALAKSGHKGDRRIIINQSKLDHEGFIYVNQKIAQRIKPHQIEGVRFMWNQVVTDENSLQGCLLAHTMGLGKTMQVITLLVAIAEASLSIDEMVSSQVPGGLRVSKTLVLCPPGLIDNWMDELLTWAPKDVLGGFRKVDQALKPPDRLRTINDWYHDGGVLILGYEMFRNLVNNKKPKNRDAAPLDDSQHEQVQMQLTQGPNIIIADEAHRMKNATAAVTIAASQFRSRSRIALTGSPLANNVEEYHTMIEWVAPNYLGPAVEFRAKYVEPIQSGLWHDSTPYERRISLKMLGVLKEDLSPKVHRADMAVLRNDLPPKKEFVITVPLTELQRKAYSIYVRSMISASSNTLTKAGEVTSTTLWHWLAVLSLLCNHPDCFWAKLNERKEDARKGTSTGTATPVSRDGTDEEDATGIDLNAPVWKVGVSETLVMDETKLFKEEAADMKSIDLSNKVKILCQILDASKAAGDKVLVFSQSIPTLDFLEELCIRQHRKQARLDGSTTINKRQSLTKAFNSDDTDLYLISTTAGGLGLNLFGANRVVIFDFKFNPIMEEQAVGRAYRIGQKKNVFVYRFVVGGTFEDSVHNKAIFKKQLASRVIDKKNPVAWAKKKLGDFLFDPKDVQQNDLTEFEGMDPEVLDKILASQCQTGTIRAIVQSDTFEKDDEDSLTVEEQKEVNQLLSDEKLKRSDPQAWHALVMKRNQSQLNLAAGIHPGAGSARPGFHNNTPRVPQGTYLGAQRAASSTIMPQPKPMLGMNGFRGFSATQPNVDTRSIASNDVPNPHMRDPTAIPLSTSSANPTPGVKSLTASADGSPYITPVAFGGRSPLLGASTKIRSISPESRSTLPTVRKPSSASTSISPAGEIVITPAPNKSTDGVANQEKQKQVSARKRIHGSTQPVEHTERYFSDFAVKGQRKIECALIEASNQSQEASNLPPGQEPRKIAANVSAEIMATLAHRVSSKEVLDATIEAAATILQADKTKSQALLTSRMNPDAFVRGVVRSVTAGQSAASSDGIEDVGKVCNSNTPTHCQTPQLHLPVVYQPPIEATMVGRKEPSAEGTYLSEVPFTDTASAMPSEPMRKSSPSARSRKVHCWFNKELQEHLKSSGLGDEGITEDMIACRIVTGKASPTTTTREASTEREDLIGNNVESPMYSDMHKAMSRQPVLSLRTPVAKPSGKKSSLVSQAEKDSWYLQKVAEKRLAKAQKSATTNSGLFQPATTNAASGDTRERPLPHWAESIVKANSRGPNHRESRASLQSTTPK